MNTLTRHQIVLHWFERHNSDHHRYPPEPRNYGPQVFRATDSDPAAWDQHTVVVLPYETWQDMGGPVDITVTVKPGDCCNP